MNWYDILMMGILAVWVVWLVLIYGVVFPYMAFKIWDKLYPEED